MPFSHIHITDVLRGTNKISIYYHKTQMDAKKGSTSEQSIKALHGCNAFTTYFQWSRFTIPFPSFHVHLGSKTLYCPLVPTLMCTQVSSSSVKSGMVSKSQRGSLQSCCLRNCKFSLRHSVGGVYWCIGTANTFFSPEVVLVRMVV